MVFRLQVLALALSASLVAAACGGTASISPTAPSGSASGATITGQVSGGSAAIAPSGDGGTITLQAVSSSTITVRVAGTSIASTTDRDGHFVLNGVPGGTVQLEFTGAGTNAMITIAGVSPSDQIDITVSLRGNSAHVDSERRHGNNGVEVNGRISSIDGGARRFVVDGRTVSVPVTAAIRHGSTTLLFGTLKVGDHVEVKGTFDGSVLVASEVKVEQEGDDD